MLSEHPNLKDLPQDDKEGLWVFNYIFHMMDLFDNKQQIKEIKIDSLTTCQAMLERFKVTEVAWHRHLKRWYSKSKTYNQYCLYINKEILEEMYKDYIEDSTIITNYIEILILHEMAHLKYFSHSKRFFKYWLRLIKKWLEYMGEEDTYELYQDYIRKDKRRYKNGRLK